MPIVHDRVDELCARFALPAGSADRLLRLMDLVAEEPLALTTVREPGRAVEAHLADSLAGLELPAVRDAHAIADLGSGAGFPALVLAVAIPGAAVRLVESVGKKAAFLGGASEALGLGNVEVVRARAEDWLDGVGRHDLVTARALAPLPVLVEYASPLLAEGGALVAWKGRRDRAEEEAGARAAHVLGMTSPAAHSVPDDLVRGADERHLYLSLKVAKTPSGYPRRAGMARKRPLGTSS